jgi:RimJ/RimL family protein N-acetyltransferase
MHKYALTLRKADKYDLKSIMAHRVDNRQYYQKASTINEEDFIKWLDAYDLSSPRSMILIGIDHDDVVQPICSWQMVGVGYICLADICHENRTASISCNVYEQSRHKTISHKLLLSGIEYCRHVLNLIKLKCEVRESDAASKSILDRTGFIRDSSHYIANQVHYHKSLG